MSSAVIDPNRNDGSRETISLLLMLIGTLLIILSASPMLAAGIFILVMSILVNMPKPNNEKKQ